MRLTRWAAATLVACGLIAAGTTPATAAPLNDNFASATLLPSSTSVTISGTNVEGTTEAGEDYCCWLRHSVWFKWTAPKTGNYRLELCNSTFNNHWRVSTGGAVNALDEVGESDADPGCRVDGSGARGTFIAFAGQEYKIQIGSDVENQTGTFNGSLSLVSPPNDFFADATTLEGTSAPINGTNVDATNETAAGEDNCCWVYHSIWYRWTAPKTGNYRLETCGSSFNSHVKVLTGTVVNALQKVADNDDAAGCGADGKRARVEFIAGAGQQYWIQIGSDIQNQTGSLSGSLTLVSPANDFFADATTLAGNSAPINGTNVDATNEAGEDNCCWTYGSVWYRWVAPATGSYTVDVCGSSFNTHIKVLTGTAVNALQKIADNDDAPGCGPDGLRSRVTFSAGAGQTYYIQVGSQGEPRGNIVGSIAPAAPAAPTPVVFPGALPSTSKPPVAGGAIRRSKGKFVLKIKGTFKLPPGLTPQQACNGTMIYTIKKGKKLITARTGKLTSKCRYTKTVQIARSKIGRAKKLRLTVRFGGNRYLAATEKTYTVKVKR